MNEAIEKIVSGILKNMPGNPKEAVFLLRYRRSCKKAVKERLRREQSGQHVPAFLISSITDSCNLFCTGCYARANGICGGQAGRSMLTAEEWDSVFRQASEMGIGFHLLAGGEPLLRRDVLLRAARHADTVYPVFTNGTMIDSFYLKLFDRRRNLIPVLSMEGTEAETDMRRGEGTYRLLEEKMTQMKNKKLLYGVSLTVTKRNLDAVTDPGFMQFLYLSGCRLVFFIEYVPADASARSLAFSQEDRDIMEVRQHSLRRQFPAVLMLSFPGDEKHMGGCLAAGRGFFHISPYGDAEACPFAPYSDCNLRKLPLAEALRSPFFRKLQAEHLTAAGHAGGCALFERKETVQAVLAQSEPSPTE